MPERLGGSSPLGGATTQQCRSFDPIAAALALAIREAIAKREVERAERRATLTVVVGGKGGRAT
ncbi:MAG TPA: hypothetical protein VGQ58_04195 [Candidatus Limnocylindrales bacterium]|jgi:hypothetical protein|nr:hypothetical protein [Candidatus Limnocylindrales bacterium]